MRKAALETSGGKSNLKTYIEETIRKRTDYVMTSNTELKTTTAGGNNEKLTNHQSMTAFNKNSSGQDTQSKTILH